MQLKNREKNLLWIADLFSETKRPTPKPKGKPTFDSNLLKLWQVAVNLSDWVFSFCEWNTFKAELTTFTSGASPELPLTVTVGV